MFNDYTSKTAKYVSYLGWALLVIISTIGAMTIASGFRNGDDGNIGIGFALLVGSVAQYILFNAFSIVVEAC